MIIWVDCPAGTKLLTDADKCRLRASFLSRLLCSMLSCSWRIGRTTACPDFSGASRSSELCEGSSMLMLMRSTRNPRRSSSSDDAP